MNRKGALIVACILAAVAAGSFFALRKPGPRSTVPAPGREVSEVNSESVNASGGESGGDGPLCFLKGSDFKVECLADQDEVSERITVTLANGKVPDFVEWDGKVDHPVNTVFSKDDRVTLEKVIPGERREQMVVEGEAYLPQGQGTISTRNIYWIQENGIHEVAHLILSRTPGDDSPEGSRSLAATAQLTPQGTILYESAIDRAPPRKLELKWDGMHFADPTGEFERISQEFTP